MHRAPEGNATRQDQADPPEALQAVPIHEASGLVPLKKEETSELDEKVAKFVDELAALDSNSPEFGKKVDQLTAMGRKEIAEAAGASNRFLDRPVKAIDSDTGIGADLTELRRTVEALDPKETGKGMTTRKFLGIIPFGNKVNNYFDKYRSSQTHISAILQRLGNGKDELLMDNAAIDTERAGLWKTMHRLEQMIHISKSLDKTLEDKANELDATDPAKAKAIRETALFYTRQRTTDLLTQMAVTVQGYLASTFQEEQCRSGQGVDRASPLPSPLRTAVTVLGASTSASCWNGPALTSPRQHDDTTGELLKHSGAIHEQAAVPFRGDLQRAFQNISTRLTRSTLSNWPQCPQKPTSDTRQRIRQSKGIRSGEESRMAPGYTSSPLMQSSTAMNERLTRLDLRSGQRQLRKPARPHRVRSRPIAPTISSNRIDHSLCCHRRPRRELKRSQQRFCQYSY